MSDKSSSEGMPFSAFVLSLSTTALAALGQCDDPAFMEIPREPEIVRNNIDILLMLREKTKGNLTADEEQLISSVIYDLQMRYLQETQH
ncbi:MAG: DUF1844 domain-containing protein [Proteobacteria bacterium]|jgi:hypothetical protein|nr:DUF1844 domain-containing protein [Pseudomonadota bacterium]MBQ9818062.1 DUF1844 domain-containing protein [Pseudomonadota bacterium]